jgi:hypothetical protein
MKAKQKGNYCKCFFLNFEKMKLNETKGDKGYPLVPSVRQCEQQWSCGGGIFALLGHFQGCKSSTLLLLPGCSCGLYCCRFLVLDCCGEGSSQLYIVRKTTITVWGSGASAFGFVNWTSSSTAISCSIWVPGLGIWAGNFSTRRVVLNDVKWERMGSKAKV